MSGGKLNLIAKIPADRELETKLHQKYYNYRSHGEWFSLNRCHLKELKEMPGTIKKYFKGVDDVTFYSATREELIDFLNHGR